MIIRKAVSKDIDAVVSIYDKIHTAEEKGEVVIGWKRDIYPTKKTAEDALLRQDLFLMEEEGVILGSGIINKEQVDVYAKAKWEYDAEPEEIMVLHTLVIDPDKKRKGLGKSFVKFYEEYAKNSGCKYLRLDTNEKNVNARGMYKKMGYREIGIVPCVFNGLEDVNLVLIEKALEI